MKRIASTVCEPLALTRVTTSSAYAPTAPLIMADAAPSWAATASPCALTVSAASDRRAARIAVRASASQAASALLAEMRFTTSSAWVATALLAEAAASERRTATESPWVRMASRTSALSRECGRRYCRDGL